MIIKGLFTSTIYRGDLDFQGHFDPWIFQFFNFKDSSVFFVFRFFSFSSFSNLEFSSFQFSRFLALSGILVSLD